MAANRLRLCSLFLLFELRVSDTYKKGLEEYFGKWLSVCLRLILRFYIWVNALSTKNVDRLIFEILTEGYREEIISLLKYRRLAASLDRLYGSKDLSGILLDEEKHARLFLDLAKELDFDVADIGEQALIKELDDMARSELKISKFYELILTDEKVSNERVLAILRDMVEDSKRHRRMLIELREKLLTFSSNHLKG